MSRTKLIFLSENMYNFVLNKQKRLKTICGNTDIETTTKSNNVSPNAHSTFAQMSWIFSLAWEVSYPSKTCNSNHTAEVFMVLDFLKEYIAFDVFLRKTIIIILQLTAIFQELNNQNTCTASFSWLKAHKC